MHALLDRQDRERNDEWKKEVYDRRCYGTEKAVVRELWHTLRMRIAHYESCMFFLVFWRRILLSYFAISIRLLNLLICNTHSDVKSRLLPRLTEQSFTRKLMEKSGMIPCKKNWKTRWKLREVTHFYLNVLLPA